MADSAIVPYVWLLALAHLEGFRLSKRPFACPSSGTGCTAAWYVSISSLFVFSLCERKNEKRKKIKYRSETHTCGTAYVLLMSVARACPRPGACTSDRQEK